MTLSDFFVIGMFFAIVIALVAFAVYSRSAREAQEFTPNEKYKPRPALRDDYPARAYALGNYRGIIDYADRRLNENPDNVNALFWRALAREKIGEDDGCIRDTTRLMNLTPDDKRLWTLRGKIYDRQNKVEEAIADYSRAIEMGVRDVAVYLHRAKLYDRQGKYAEAVSDVTRSLQFGVLTTTERSFHYRVRSQSYMQLKWPDLALADAEQAVELDPDNPMSYLALAGAYLAMQDYTTCVVECDRVLYMTDGSNIPAYWRRIEANKALKQFDEVGADYERLLEVEPNQVEVYLHRAWFLLTQKDFDGAVADCDRILKLTNGENLKALGIRGDARFRQKRYEEALADYNRLIELDSRHEAVLLQRSWLHYRMLNYAACIADCDRVLELSGGQTLQAFVNRGDAYMRLNDIERALVDVRQALAINPDFLPALISLGYYHLRLAHYDDAIQICSRAIELSGNGDTRPLSNRAQAYKYKRMWEEALADVDRITAMVSDAEKPEALLYRGDIIERSSGHAEALKIYDQVVQLAPEYGCAWDGRGFTLATLGRLDEALASCNKAVEFNDIGHDHYSSRAYTHFLSGNYEQALADFTRGLEMDSYGRLSRIGIAVSLHALGQPEEARRSWDKLIALDGRFRDVDTVVQEYHPAEAFVAEARKIIAELPPDSAPGV